MNNRTRIVKYMLVLFSVLVCMASFADDAVPGVGTVRDGILSSNLVVNAGSLHVVTNEAAMKSASILVDDLDRSIGAGTFTIEGFFRWMEQANDRTGTHYFFTEHHASAGRAIDVYFDKSGRVTAQVIAKMTTEQVDEDTGEVTNVVVTAEGRKCVSNYGSFFDGEWHHLALVYDHEYRTVKFYTDYHLRGSVGDVPEIFVKSLHASYQIIRELSKIVDLTGKTEDLVIVSPDTETTATQCCPVLPFTSATT